MSFVVSDILHNYLLLTKLETEKHAELLLVLTFLLNKIKDENLKQKIVQFIFNRKVGLMHADLFLNNFDSYLANMEKYFPEMILNSKYPLIANQLIHVFEKHLVVKFDNYSNSSLNDSTKQAIKILGKDHSSPEFKLHTIITQRTGMVSYIPWTNELLPFAMNDPFALITTTDDLIENQIRTLLLVQLNVRSVDKGTKETNPVVDFIAQIGKEQSGFDDSSVGLF